ncbi:aldehyde dehydrogenase family protein [Pseudonocardia kujensis]|uniref:aldehyde dehydrogenase family protein n=1 Tax=Pseudonocardia kujensis TaxID=1128675 RepID=UPI001E5F5209|nr:aldehyde dehydrogenase family protein [Pseudonocardia kujensis]MCE0761963.1 aldehyde dehydrogenase family protein [Pseudonocardia kujensis]
MPVDQIGDVYVAGRWRTSGSERRTAVVDPTTEDPLAEVVSADAADVDAAVRAADAVARDWGATPVVERCRLVVRLAEEIERRASGLTETITRENGTPVAESAHAPTTAAAHLRHCAEVGPSLFAEDVRPNPMAPGDTLVQRRPLGVAGLITPWNYPLSLIVVKLGPALVAGCPVVIKPAAETPLAARMLMDAVEAAGLPAGVVNLVTGDGATGQALVEHPLVRTISFTGSTAVGRSIGEACGRALRPVVLELGGKSPALVLDDADPEVIARSILKVSMRNTGQTCKACTRLIVPNTRRGEIVDLVADVVSSAPLGDPFDPSTFFGPLVSARQRDRVLGYLESGHAEGAKAVVGGGTPAGRDRGFFVEPTVFDDVTPSMRIAREEIFGPVLSVLGYDGLDEGVALANDTPYGLAATIFSRDEGRAAAVAVRIEAGTIGINHYGSNAAAPFAGHRDSGLGVEFGLEGIEEYLALTSVHRLPRG